LRWKAATAAQALSYLLFTSDEIRVASDAEVAAWLVEKKEVLAITLRSGISGSILQCLEIEFLRISPTDFLSWRSVFCA